MSCSKCFLRRALTRSGAWRGLAFFFLTAVLFASPLRRAARAGEPLAGTAPLETKGDLTSDLIDAADRFLLSELAASVDRRPGFWHRDTSSPAAYTASTGSNRARLAKILGAADPRLPVTALELVTTTAQPALVGRGTGFEAFAVRWPVLPGVDGEGLMLVPANRPVIGDCIAIPDADQTPEMLAGLMPGIEAPSQFARRLAESGCRVLIPTLIDRADTYSAIVGGTIPTNQPHREFIYRQSYEMGRHIIGYEVQKVLALVDWLDRERSSRAGGAKGTTKIGVFGYGEGGLLALYAGALDPRIDVTVTSGYFEPRERVWQEPIYRNVWGLLEQFGDAELASLVAPRGLIVEAARAPAVSGPPAPRANRRGAAPGRLETPALSAVEAELARARKLMDGLELTGPFEVIATAGGQGAPGSEPVLEKFLSALLTTSHLEPSGAAPSHLRGHFRADARLKRQFDQLIDFTQRVVADSEATRATFWAKADRMLRSADKWRETTRPYRQYFSDEVIGRFDRPLEPPRPRSRQVYDTAAYTGYEVVLDVFPGLFAYGILLVPKDIRPDERRPVVVCQHGLEGRPRDVVENTPAEHYYHQFAARLAERGYITFAPQNLYIFQDRFRTLQRKGNPLKKSLFSLIVPQHQQVVNWLGGLPMVDPARIAFYGLSYGGKTAMRVPSLVEGYCLSICSGDFNEWIWRNTSMRYVLSYIVSNEYEMPEFDLGNTFNYAEMAGLIAPRPFMVERGHRDQVGIDEWVLYEYAKVRLLYVDLKIPERTTIEYFDGPHTIHGVGTFGFLDHELHWTARTR